jgi:adenosine phosphosulfate reductase beta subunit
MQPPNLQHSNASKGIRGMPRPIENDRNAVKIGRIDPRNIEPNMCWECYACVKACPQFAIDCRGYADFAPLSHSVRVRREEDKATIA